MVQGQQRINLRPWQHSEAEHAGAVVFWPNLALIGLAMDFYASEVLTMTCAS